MGYIHTIFVSSCRINRHLDLWIQNEVSRVYYWLHHHFRRFLFCTSANLIRHARVRSYAFIIGSCVAHFPTEIPVLYPCDTQTLVRG